MEDFVFPIVNEHNRRSVFGILYVDDQILSLQSELVD